jgi:hypothetical protein
VLYLMTSTDGTRCKILEVTDDYVLVKIPRSEVALMDREGGSPAEPVDRGEAGAPGPATAGEPASARSWGARGASPEVLPLVGAGHVEGGPPRFVFEERGSAVGRVLWDGRPIAGCKVRLMMLSGSGFWTGAENLEVESVTDEDGVYRFDLLRPGECKLLWLPPDGTHWIRRLRVEPDFTVPARGGTTDVAPLEVNLATLN